MGIGEYHDDYRDASIVHPSIGTPLHRHKDRFQEMPMRGMGSEEMRTIARLMVKAAQGKSPEDVGREAAQLAEAFDDVCYCFEPPFPASALQS